jgi:RimJ/RimL family protein N-acetyltransferase
MFEGFNVELNNCEINCSPFKTYPTEWNMKFSGSNDLKTLKEITKEVARKVKERNGEYLIHISEENEPKLRSIFYEIGFEDYFIKIFSELNLVSFHTPDVQLPNKITIYHWPSFTQDFSDYQKNEFLKELYLLECRTSDDIPRKLEFKHPTFQEYLKRFDNGEAERDTIFFAQINSRIIGFTYAYFKSSDDEKIQPGIFYTGVSDEFRGLGIETAVKIKLANYLKSNCYSKLETSNVSHNTSIIRTNQKLGFKKIKSQHFLWLNLDKLK